MFKKFTNGCVRVVNRWLPDAFLFAIILTLIVFVAAMCATGMGPIEIIAKWGDAKGGFWNLLAFSMQMALVLVFGSAMASARPCKKALRAVAGLCHTNKQAILVTTFVSTICCWLNWGFGLVIGALLAKEVVRRVPTVDYPLLIASAYSGFVIWHAGLSGSIPLDLVAGKQFGEVTYQAAITETVFHPMNLIMCGVILLLMPLVNYAMHPDKDHTVTVNPALLLDEEEKTYSKDTPAEKLEHSKILWLITVVIASAYSGFVIWHAGLSGSIPLDLVAGKQFGEVTYQAAITETVFHPMNLIMCGVILLLMPLVNYAMHPDKDHTVTVNPALLLDEEEKTYSKDTPAEKLEHSKILWLITVVFGFAYIVYYFVNNGFTLGLNIVNMIFLFLGLLLHGDLRRYVDAIAEAAAGAAGILLQFPFYAGIMGMMVATNEQGVSLAGVISQFFVDISNNVTFPMLSFLAAGIVNFFVPSGGGQWAVQGPIMMPAGAEMGIEAGRTAMAIAWGDQWTNMIQPFWALPALGIAKLSARDIMGYLVVVLLFTGAVACLGFLGWALFFT